MRDDKRRAAFHHFFERRLPGDARRLAKVPKLIGKPVAIFLTYAINPGKTVEKLRKILES